MMQLGAEGNFVGSGIFKSEDPARRARAIVEATTHFEDPERVAEASMELGEAMPGLEIEALASRRRAAAGSRLVRLHEPLRIGVLALQGDFEAHRRMLRGARRRASEVRTARQLDGLDGLVIPGGESTTITMGMERDGLDEPIRDFPTAGARPRHLRRDDRLRPRAPRAGRHRPRRRNAFGRQLQSFEADLRGRGLGDEPLRAVFIRAPWVEEHGAGVEVLAEIDGHPVAVRERQRAGGRVPPGADGRPAAARALHGDVHRRRAEQEARGCA